MESMSEEFVSQCLPTGRSTNCCIDLQHLHYIMFLWVPQEPNLSAQPGHAPGQADSEIALTETGLARPSSLDTQRQLFGQEVSRARGIFFVLQLSVV